MNSTNRAVNRAVLLIVGVLLLAAGGAVIAARVWPQAWGDVASVVTTWWAQANEASHIEGFALLSWLLVGILVLLLAVIVIAIVIMSRLGRGHSAAVTRVESAEGAQGPVSIGQQFAADAVTHSLASHDELLSTRVSARRVRGADVLHVAVTPRQNTSPAHVANTVVHVVDNLEALMGRATPTCVTIRSAFRARLAADQSRVN